MLAKRDIKRSRNNLRRVYFSGEIGNRKVKLSRQQKANQFVMKKPGGNMKGQMFGLPETVSTGDGKGSKNGIDSSQIILPSGQRPNLLCED